MGTDLQEYSAEARRLYALADEVSGRPISRLCADGPLECLTATDVAQPAVVTTSLSALSVIRESFDVKPAAVAGHSVGELAAYIAAGVLDEQRGLELVRCRAEAMAQACALVEGGMLAVLGLDEATLRVACQSASEPGSSVAIANDNAPGQLIVAGERTALERLSAYARSAGARKIIPLNVAGPFHSDYMRPAASVFHASLNATHFAAPEIDIVLNATARPSRIPAELCAELAVQIYSDVRWTDSLRALRALGCDRFLELGPGTALAGMVKRTLPGARVASFGSLADKAKVEALLDN